MNKYYICCIHDDIIFCNYVTFDDGCDACDVGGLMPFCSKNEHNDCVRH